MTSQSNHDPSAVVVIGIDIGKDVFHLGGFSADTAKDPVSGRC